jgi:Amt family ammonium transporter
MVASRRLSITFGQFGIQLVGVLAFAVFSIVTSFILWSVLGAVTGGIRVSEGEELEGLDIGQPGMEAYPDFTPIPR